MLDRLTGKPVHLYTHMVACSLIAAGLPASKIPLSLGTMLCVLNLLLEADFRSYWQHLKTNKLAWGLWAYIACEWLSLCWTSDWSYAAHDLKAKLPLYAIPLVLVAKPIATRKQLFLLVGLFLASLFVTSVLNVSAYFGWWGHKTYDDIRGLSLFTSHIRYALMIVLGIALAGAWLLYRLPYRSIAVLLIAWWGWYTYFSQVISGYLALAVVLLVGLLLLLNAIRSRTLKVSVFSTALLLMVAAVWWTIDFFRPVPHLIDLEHYPTHTVNGHPYRRDSSNLLWENGYPIAALISDHEIPKAWNSASDIDYFTGYDEKGNRIYYTIWRYMASKRLAKDSLGFTHMSPTDVRNVEKGVASVLLTSGGARARFESIKHQLEHPGDPNGHSLLQRLEYWKAARTIVRKHWLFGVGTGDVAAVFAAYYATSNTHLLPELQLRAHNQYLTTMISSGIFGLLAFLLWWVLLVRSGWKHRQFAVLSFCGIMLSSFLIEDTLETQMGVTLVAFFFGLLAGASSLVKNLRSPKNN